jgi:hypothetical protein
MGELCGQRKKRPGGRLFLLDPGLRRDDIARMEVDPGLRRDDIACGAQRR